ncbi:MAG: hypothetical protein DUD33_06290 [Coriobacteriaceae bacterium]|mgnify:CR=1 FL=1|jgi:hypothetical protein|nr:MAG: hypothetical protein DUD33_06290 [Coriobacteriaceae bacterium]
MVKVHDRVTKRHPELSVAGIRRAWDNRVAMALRETSEQDFYIAIGFDDRGRELEMVSVVEDDGTILIFHAMTPPSKKTLFELGIRGGSR